MGTRSRQMQRATIYVCDLRQVIISGSTALFLCYSLLPPGHHRPLRIARFPCHRPISLAPAELYGVD